MDKLMIVTVKEIFYVGWLKYLPINAVEDWSKDGDNADLFKFSYADHTDPLNDTVTCIRFVIYSTVELMIRVDPHLFVTNSQH